jgi:hypothetical protein
MIELTILDAAENIEKYHKETKTWKDKKVVRKDIKTDDLVLKIKKNWENPVKLQEPWEGPFIAKKQACQGEDHVWFEDRWMVASLCDE